MAVILLNPNERFIGTDGRETGPLRMTEPCAFDLIQVIVDIIDKMEEEDDEDVRAAFNTCIEMISDYAHRAGIQEWGS